MGRVAVIGSGVSGLAAAKKLLDDGHDVRVFEARSTVGGIWTSSALYKNVRLQQSVFDYNLDGHPWRAGTADFPSGGDVAVYLIDFVKRNGLAQHISLCSRVVDAQFDDAAGTWTLTIRSDSSAAPATEKFDFLVVATGNLQNDPVQSSAAPVSRIDSEKGPRGDSARPAALADFAGRVLHSWEYFAPCEFAGKRVAIVGAGASGVEIATDLARSAAEVHILSRNTPDWVCPRHGLFGEPLKVCGTGVSTPLWIRNLYVRLVLAAQHGVILPGKGSQPEWGPLDRRIIASDEFYTFIKHGLIKPHLRCGELTGSDGLHVMLRDEVIGADVVILATGTPAATFTAGSSLCSQLQFLHRHISPRDMPLNCYHSLFHPRVPRAAFVGFAHGFASVPRAATMQAAYIGRLMAGKAKLPPPDVMQRKIQQAMAKDEHGSSMSLTSAAYVSEIRYAAGLGKLPDPATTGITRSVLAVVACAALVKVAGIRAEYVAGGLLAAGCAGGVALYRRLLFSAPTDRELAGRSDAEDKLDSALNIMNATLDGTDESAMHADGGKKKEDEEAQVRATYQNWAAEYDGAMDTLGWRALDSLVAYVEKCVPARSVETCLDIGCGTGLVAECLRAKCYSCEFVGFDLCPEMLKLAEARCTYKSLKTYSLLKTPWPYATASFDLQVCNGVLRYTTEGGKSIMDEMARLARPGGFIVFHCPDVSWAAYSAAAERLEKDGMWRLIECSGAFINFNGIGEQDTANCLARIRVYQRGSRTHPHELQASAG